MASKEGINAESFASPTSLGEAEAILNGLASVFLPADSTRPQPVADSLENQTETTSVSSQASSLEARYRTLLEQIPAVVFMASLDQGIGEAYVSPHIEALLGFTQEEWLNDPVRWYHQIHPADKTRWSEEAAQMFLTGEPLKSVYRVMARDGHVVWFRCEAKMVRRDDGRPWFIHGIGFDITEIKEAEEQLQNANNELRAEIVERRRIDAALLESEGRYRGIIESALDAVVTMDEKGLITAWNAQAENIFGWTKEEAVGRSLSETIIPPQHREAHEAGMRHFLITGEGPMFNKRFEIAALHRTGREFPVEFALSAARSEGKVTFSGFIRDITEHKTLEAQFRQAQKMDAVGTLAGGVAHDFNNLLTTILGYSELLLEVIETDSPLRLDVEEIKHAGERAAALTQQLLAFSRKQIIELKVLDLNAVMADMDRMLRRLVGEDIELVTVSDPLLGHVKADRGQMEQVVMNLAVNSRDAMPRGGKLTFESGNVELENPFSRDGFQIEPGSYVALSFTDTGIGMDSETQSRIFEPFFTTKGTGQGTGLGLSTVYGIVKQSGGYIWVDSEPGVGTCFQIYLRRVDQELDRVKSSDVSRPLSGKETILLVEDEDAVRRLVQTTLSRQGYTVLEAHDGKEAMRLAEEFDRAIELVLTDAVMPGMSVGDLIAGLRSLRPEALTLIMSGYTTESIVRRGIMESDMAFLEKPFTSTALLRKVREVLDAR